VYALHFGHNEGVWNPVFFALVLVPLDTFLVHPGVKTLGIHSDPQFYTLLTIFAFFHGIGFYFIQRGIRKYKALREKSATEIY
jgi:drug/metabolite transporter (DMT)-like permease